MPLFKEAAVVAVQNRAGGAAVEHRVADVAREGVEQVEPEVEDVVPFSPLVANSSVCLFSSSFYDSAQLARNFPQRDCATSS